MFRASLPPPPPPPLIRAADAFDARISHAGFPHPFLLLRLLTPRVPSATSTPPHHERRKSLTAARGILTCPPFCIEDSETHFWFGQLRMKLGWIWAAPFPGEPTGRGHTPTYRVPRLIVTQRLVSNSNCRIMLQSVQWLNLHPT